MRPVFRLLFDEFEELAWPRDCRVLQLTSDIQEISIAVERELGIRVVRHFQEIIVPLVFEELHGLLSGSRYDGIDSSPIGAMISSRSSFEMRFRCGCDANDWSQTL